MDHQLAEFAPAIAAQYGKAPEDDRLEQSPFPLVAMRMRQPNERRAPSAPARVCFAGGAG